MDERIVRAGAEIARLSRTDRQVRDNTAQLELVTRGLTTTREEFNKLVDSMRDVQAARPAATAPARTAAPTGGSGGPDPVASTATGAWPADGIYTIQSGDTFSRIAARFNIKLEDLERVNPGVDSRRLQIGQKIQLPKP
jgi:LysM repeat protein